jgi:hypothetical protein
MNVIKRLEHLVKMITKYRHCWTQSPSARLIGWVDEYDQLRAEHYSDFCAYCAKHGFTPEHNGRDVLA